LNLLEGAGVAEPAGFVLAGGESSRMGTDKSLVQLDGESLIVRALAILNGAGLEAAIAGARCDLSAFGPVIEDDGGGPLSGVCAALESTDAEFSIFVSVDMPLVPPSLVSFLLDHAHRTGSGVALASVSGFAQTFPAVVHRSALPALQSELSAGRNGCYAAFCAAAKRIGRPFQVVAVEYLVQSGQVEDARYLPAAFWFLNINTPDDLARVQSCLSRAIA